MDPLDRDLVDRVYAKDAELDALIKRVQELRETVPNLTISTLSNEINNYGPSVP